MTLELVRQILMQEWDPLNVRQFGVEDEYDSYIPRILNLLESGASASAISTELSEISKTQMLMDTPASLHDNAARRLVGLLG